jgi:hypothetical protein
MDSLAGACGTYLALAGHAKSAKAKALRAREFEGLIKAAGGTQEKAAMYCRSLFQALHRRYPSGGAPAVPLSGLPVSVPASPPPSPLPSLPVSLPRMPTMLPSLPLPNRGGLPIPHPTNLPVPHPVNLPTPHP